MRRIPSPTLLALSLLLSGCAMEDSERVQQSRSTLVGLSRADLFLCAGFPSKRERIDVVREMMTYELGGGSGSGLNLNLPVVGALNLTGAAGYCRATFELIDAHVTRVGFSGDKNLPAAPDALCAPLIRACLDWPREAPQPAMTPLPPAAPPAVAAPEAEAWR